MCTSPPIPSSINKNFKSWKSRGTFDCFPFLSWLNFVLFTRSYTHLITKLNEKGIELTMFKTAASSPTSQPTDQPKTKPTTIPKTKPTTRPETVLSKKHLYTDRDLPYIFEIELPNHILLNKSFHNTYKRNNMSQRRLLLIMVVSYN